MKFPYGNADFDSLITEGYFYVDRTDRIPLIEEAGKPLLFLRPRRFGKSLLLSMLENYYDVKKAEKFEKLFGHLAIGQNPTPLHNQYFIMKWDFSAVDSSGGITEIKQTLYRYLNGRIRDFAVRYKPWLPIEIEIQAIDALASFQSLLTAVQQTPYQLYLLIDEYDNFANTVMMSSQLNSTERYEDLIEGEGLLKTVFKVVKSSMAGLGVDRVFITGVSPIVMSDMTSGFNIAENISLEPEFHDLCGFGSAEIRAVMQQVGQNCQLEPEEVADTLATVKEFYDGYCFTHHHKLKVYNSTSVIYFLKYWQKYCQLPHNMLDDNLAMDSAKLSYISSLSGGRELILSALSESPPVSIEQLSTRFGLKDMLSVKKSEQSMASLLYYFGILTLQGTRDDRGKLLLTIPNMVVQRLYVERLQELFLPDLDQRKQGKQAAELLYTKGQIRALCDFIEQHYFKVFDNRDAMSLNELTIKTIFLLLLFNDHFYLMGSETELSRHYADLTMIVRPQMRQYPSLLDVLLEFKSVKLREVKLSAREARKLSREQIKKLDQVAERLKEAKAQAKEYGQALVKRHGSGLRLRLYAVVALGFERLVWEEVVVKDGTSNEADEPNAGDAQPMRAMPNQCLEATT